MAIPLILAMTGAEIRKNTGLPPKIAWMACHFSPTEPGLSDLPPALPSSAMVILNDEFPIREHDPKHIIRQLSDLKPPRLLLDLQRPPTPETQRIVNAIVHALPCPVGVARPYAEDLDCPVFLPPLPPHIPMDEYLQPWNGREIWLEAALDAVEITVTAHGSTTTALPFARPEENAHTDRSLHCHYKIYAESNALRFYLYRTADDIAALLDTKMNPNITCAVGLFHELG